MNTLVITYDLDPRGRAVVTEAIGDLAQPVWLADLDDQARASALRNATALLARNTGRELRPHEPALIEQAKLIQYVNAGIDFIPLKVFHRGVPIASNGGAYAEPMAEHGLAMALAAAKRLIVEHTAMQAGAFNQHKRNRMLAGGVCGILGFGGIGVATARLMRGIGMRVHAINRRGASEEPVDWIGTPDRMGEMLATSDVLIVCTPLTRKTVKLLGAAELARMKPNAILVNLARGEVIDEAALFAHLHAQPAFVACIDAWWVEPVRQGEFRMDLPFLTLPNVIGSPHNSASVTGQGVTGLQRAIANVKRALTGETPRFLIGEDERLV